MRITLIVNPGSADAVAALREGAEALRGAGHAVRARLTFERRDARRFARDAAREGAELVVAAGGDGTIHEVVNGLQDYAHEPAPFHAAPLPRLGIVPLGTGNDFAGAQGIPEDPGEALAGAVVGTPRRVDVPMLNGHAFLNVSTGGFGAEATEETSSAAKRVLGPLAYMVTGVQKFVSLEASTACFTADEVFFEGPFVLFAVGNGRRTGGGNWLTPHAELDDGLLDVCVVREISRVEFLNLLPLLRNGEHLDHEAVVYRRVPRLRVEAEQELSVNVDGEPLRGRRWHYGFSPFPLCVALPE
ncbi:MAG: YegS/Rv2252/BmrU family lipid kinase [Gemmatimonadota bacterium]|nr:YegS/Rv2252/BmrU family lipid kinase [Gemmatimonadota bacterium]